MVAAMKMKEETRNQQEVRNPVNMTQCPITEPRSPTGNRPSEAPLGGDPSPGAGIFPARSAQPPLPLRPFPSGTFSCTSSAKRPMRRESDWSITQKM